MASSSSALPGGAPQEEPCCSTSGDSSSCPTTTTTTIHKSTINEEDGLSPPPRPTPYEDGATAPPFIDEQEDITKEDIVEDIAAVNSTPPPPPSTFRTLALPLNKKKKINNDDDYDDDEVSSSKTTHSPCSDTGTTTEDAARISSSMSQVIPAEPNTLSDISGPCSSSQLDKVAPATHLTMMMMMCPRTSSSTSSSSASSTSSSSLSDTSSACSGCDERAIVCGSLKDELPPPLHETEEDEDDDDDGGGGCGGGSSRDQGIVPMTVDTCEDYFTRLHDVRINGCILEYAGIGKSVHDNGFAQSNVPLTPINHYYEITILDPGENCYISIGLARKDYNMHRNPGWCRGSIAFHADDGKIFIGGGVGTPFGPRCSTNDVLGCGIIFPMKYGEIAEGSTWPWEVVVAPESSDKKVLIQSKRGTTTTRHRRKARAYSMDNFGDLSSESEDDIWWNNTNQVCEDKVKVFFMRNHKLLGIKEVRIPKGGFYPTIGMMSTNERVSVDLHPLSG